MSLMRLMIMNNSICLECKNHLNCPAQLQDYILDDITKLVIDCDLFVGGDDNAC